VFLQQQVSAAFPGLRLLLQGPSLTVLAARCESNSPTRAGHGDRPSGGNAPASGFLLGASYHLDFNRPSSKAAVTRCSSKVRKCTWQYFLPRNRCDPLPLVGIDRRRMSFVIQSLGWDLRPSGDRNRRMTAFGKMPVAVFWGGSSQRSRAAGVVEDSLRDHGRAPVRVRGRLRI